MRNVSLKQLRTFAAAVRSGSLSAAARSLNITPPAVTLQMQLLEEAVGMPLAERTSQGWRPTEAGQELLIAADRIQAALDDCEQATGMLKGLQAGKVNVSVVSTAKYFAPRLLAHFSRQNPSIELALAVGNREETIDTVRRFQADIAIMGRPPSDLELDTAVICDNPHVFVAAPDNPLTREATVPHQVLADQVFLMREKGSGTRTLADGFLQDYAIAPKVGMEIGSNETIKQAVMAGLGMAILSAHTITAEVSAGRLAILPVAGTPIMRQWYVVKRVERRLMPASDRLWNFMLGEGRDLLSGFMQLPQIKANDADTQVSKGGNGRGRRVTMR